MTSSTPTRLLIFTDLDGTLLDHRTYSWEPAKPALTEARERNIPIIINSSKTLAECCVLQDAMDLHGPVVFENGAGVAIPQALVTAPVGAELREAMWLKAFSPDYRAIRDLLCGLRDQHRFRFRGFGDMPPQAIEEATGLSPAAAENAARRMHTEPLVWEDSDERLLEFEQLLQQRGFAITRGGRFFHVMGQADKGTSMLWLAKLYGLPTPTLVALGDSDNDLPMLRAADIAVQIPNPGRKSDQLNGARFNREGDAAQWLRAEQPGPTGWNHSVCTIIKELTHG